MTRLDNYLVENNIFPTRSKAQLAIKEGKVRVNKRVVSKAGFDIKDTDIIEYDKPDTQYVSRGGYKLEGALKTFNISLQDLTVLDIGASTGGFTDCALQHGAKKVYAYDVGHNQLDSSLQNDNRVVAKEGINARNMTKDDIGEKVDFICMDVSFISCTKIFDSISNILEKDGKAVILFKPQFEVGNDFLNRQGIVTSDKIIKEKLENAIEFAKEKKLLLIDKMVSPIKGGDGNTEYLLYFVKQ